MFPKALCLLGIARWPLYCHKSLLSPPASPTPALSAQGWCLSCAEWALASPGPAQPHAATLPHPASAGPRIRSWGVCGGRREAGAQCAASTQSQGGTLRVLTLQTPRPLQGNYGSP